MQTNYFALSHLPANKHHKNAQSPLGLLALWKLGH